MATNCRFCLAVPDSIASAKLQYYKRNGKQMYKKLKYREYVSVNSYPRSILAFDAAICLLSNEWYKRQCNSDDVHERSSCGQKRLPIRSFDFLTEKLI